MWTVGLILSILAVFSIVTWLLVVYFFSYVKLSVTAIKYMPQVYFNYKRKSTVGWSIWMVYLDICGGSLSMFQMLTIAYNYGKCFAKVYQNESNFGCFWQMIGKH